MSPALLSDTKSDYELCSNPTYGARDLRRKPLPPFRFAWGKLEPVGWISLFIIASGNLNRGSNLHMQVVRA
jgi:hypothetical protein